MKRSTQAAFTCRFDRSQRLLLPRCKRDYPLPPHINRGSVDDLREEKIGSKIGKKPTFTAPVSAVSPSLSLSAVPATNRSHHQLLHHQLHHRSLPPTPTDGLLVVEQPPLTSFSPLQRFFFSCDQRRPPLLQPLVPTPPPFPPPEPPPTPRQASDSSSSSSARSPPTSLHRLQLQSCMQNVNLLFTFCN